MAREETGLDADTVKVLLDMEEGLALDFKRQQYPLNASASDKNELLKDVLAFTNAQRYRTAYILIGVEEVKVGRNIIVGIDDHLDDAELHQFINSKTNRAIIFDYSPHQIGDKQIGVLRIPLQVRPVYLTKRFGRLDANVVYLRDGSTTRPASPDEIVLMGRGTPPQWSVDRLEALAKAAVLTAVQHWHENPSRHVNYDAKIRDDVRFNSVSYDQARAFLLGRSRSLGDYETGIDSYDSLHWVFERFERLASYCGQMFRTVGPSLVEYGALIRAMINVEEYVEHEQKAWADYLARTDNLRAAIPNYASFNLLVAAELSIRLVDVLDSENFGGDSEYEHRREFAPEIYWQSPEWHA